MIYKRAGIMEKVNQRGKYLFIAGIISLIIAIVILFIIPDPSANNVEIAKKATSAVQAAQEISKNNQSSLLMHTIGMGLLGFGITGTVGGFILKSFKKKQGYRTKRVVFNADGTRCFLVPSAFYLFE